MSFSIYACKALLNSMFGKTSTFGALASAPTIYVGLSSTTPAEDGTGVTEPSSGSYARVETAAADWEAATTADPSVVANAEVIEFPQATGDWASGADLTHVVFYDAETSGNYLGGTALSDPKPVLTDDTPSYPVGSLEIRLD